ncbi:hypothetical protein [Methylobacterium nodulans]|uniref:DUF3077 domain-containing protein n=1 Tax=Methylobacterium nodulans (strain LMG 21967 / CNCM I-2342 / ORS 2060) TaxID=460265 RepID=B8IXV2_METNO|nr:hypothetical protein [Methylobacterium nodulans]ACL63242.1 hypothetical protein Mnod_8781 [Methylobacterium nodulans ORS 2060]
MSAPNPNIDHIAHGTPEMLFACIAEAFDLTVFKASLAADCASINDRAGLNHHAHQAAIVFEHALDLLTMLNEARKAAEAAEEFA